MYNLAIIYINDNIVNNHDKIINWFNVWVYFIKEKNVKLNEKMKSVNHKSNINNLFFEGFGNDLWLM